MEQMDWPLQQMDRQVTDADLQPVYCRNRNCNNGRPIGRMVRGLGGVVEFSCKVCKERRVIVDERVTIPTPWGLHTITG